VGIGTTTPGAKLDIAGDLFAPNATFSANYAGGRPLTVKGGPSGTANLTEWMDSTSALLAYITSNGGAVFNETGTDADLRIEGDSDINLLFTDASTDRVGIGTNSPSYKLEVVDSASHSQLGIKTTAAGFDAELKLATSGYAVTQYLDDTNGNFNFYNGGDLLTIDQSGNVGIGTTSINNKLDVSGNAGLLAQGDLRLYDADSSNYVAFQAPATVGSNLTFTLPDSYGTSGYVLSTDGSGTLSWISAASGGLGSKWNITNGAYSQINTTTDLLIGGTSSSSAKFAVLNVNSGTPTASLSAGVTGGASLTAGGVLGTTTGQSLTLGDTGTGNIVLRPNGESDDYGVFYSDGTDLFLTTIGGSNLRIAPSGTNLEFFNASSYITNGGSLTLAGDLTLSGGNIVSPNPLSVDVTGGLTLDASNQVVINSGAGSTILLDSGDNLILDADTGIFNFRDSGAAFASFTNSSTDAIIDIVGGQLILANNDTLNIGGLTGVTYNAISGAGTASFATSDNDLYIEDILEVAGSLYIAGKQITANALWQNTSNVFHPGYEYASIADLAIGGSATSSAKFQVFGNSGTASSSGNIILRGSTPVLAALNGDGLNFQTSVGGDAGLATRLRITAQGHMLPGADDAYDLGASSSARFRNLYLGPDSLHINCTTGDGCGQNVSYAAGIIPSSNTFYLGLNGNSTQHILSLTEGRNVGINTTAPAAKLDVLAATGEQLRLTNTASTAYTGFTVDGSGNLTVNPNGGLASLNGDLRILAQNELRLADADSSNYTGFVAPGTLSSDIVYTMPSADGLSGYVLSTNGSGVLTWTNVSGGINYWQMTNGTINPINSTLDLLVGGQSTASAKFAVLNMNSGTPTASLSAGASGGSYLTASGLLGTTNSQTLQLGTTGTGDVTIAPAGSVALTVKQDGKVGIGTTTPAGKLTVSGAVTGQALVQINETGDQDIFVASASGNTRFRVANNGYTYAQRYVDSANSAYYLDPAASGISLTTAGSIGVNNTAPAYEVDVTGDIHLTGRIETDPHANDVGVNLPTLNGKPVAVTGTAEGDIAWDSLNNQLYVFDGTDFRNVNLATRTGVLRESALVNVMVSNFRLQKQNISSLLDMQDAIADGFTNTNGIASSLSSNYLHNEGNYYVSLAGGQSETHSSQGSFNSAQAKTRVKVAASPLVSIETANPPADNSTIALYQFDNNGNDGGLLGNSLIVNGTPAFSTSTVKLGSHSLIGSDANYYTAPTGAFPIMTTGTIEAWVYTTSLASINTIFRSSDGTNESYLRITTAGQLSMKVGAGAAFTGTSASISTNTWNHVAMSWDGAVWRLYINGIETDSIARTNTFPASSASTNNFIARYSSGGTPLVGYLDRFAVSNTVLSVNEIKNRASLHPYAVLTSQVIDIGQTPSSLGPISWTESLGSYGDVEFQTRSSADNSTWEAWKPTTSETQLASLNADQANWSLNSATVYTTRKTDDTTIYHEGSGSLRIQNTALPDSVGSVPTDTVWNFDETTGTTAYDEDTTGTTTNLTSSGGPTVVPDGVAGAARNFNGSVQYYASAGTTANFTNYTHSNFSAWIKPSSCGAGKGGVFARNSTGGNAGLHVYLNDSCVFTIGLYDAGYAGWYNLSSGVTIPLNQWTHIAYTFTNGPLPYYMYVNGRLVASPSNYYYPGGYNAGTNYVGYAAPSASSRYFAGAIDQVVTYEDGMWTAAQVNHLYQQGLGKRVSKTLSTTDFTSKTKLPFSVAADRPGSFLSATVGENDFQNYVCDANTISLWTLDLKGDITSNTAVDQCATNTHSSYTGTNYSDSGKLASARYFDGTDDYIATSTTSLPQGANARTIDFWYKPATVNATSRYAYSYGSNAAGQAFSIGQDSTNGWFVDVQGTVYASADVPTAGQWYHIAVTYSGSTLIIYRNGTSILNTNAGSLNTGVAAGSNIGRRVYTAFGYADGLIDEVRVSNNVRSADDIAAVARISDRTNEITIDWVTHPLSGSAITNSTSTIEVPEISGNIAVGDTIILVEKDGATEYRAKNVVTGVSVGSYTTTLTVSTSAWSGTFPSGGFSEYADLTKFQREWFDMTDVTTADKDAIARITLQYTDGNQGSNVWLDDITAGGAYLTTAGGSTVTSTANRYVQYRAILSTSNLSQATTPSLSDVTFAWSTPGGGASTATVVSTSRPAINTPVVAYLAAIADLGTTGIATYSASRDGGTTWTTIPVTLQATESGSVKIYSGAKYLTNQPAGTNMRWRVQFSGDARIYGVGLWWDNDLQESGGDGLYTNSGTAVANGSYVELTHSKNTNNVVATGWVYNTGTLKWDMVDATTSDYKIEITDENHVRLYNNSGSAKDLRVDVIVGGIGKSNGVVRLAPTDSDVDTQNLSNSIWLNKTGIDGNFIKLQNGGVDVLTVEKDGTFLSGAANLATSSAFTVDTANTLTASGSKLLSLKNNGAEKFYVDANGNVYATGTITAGNGMSVPMTNKWQNAVAVRSLVTIDTTNNSSFTSTTTAYSPLSAGVVQGVLPSGDVDGDGVCDLNDTCLVAVGGTVQVNVTNGGLAARGDYVYTSTTAGSGITDPDPAGGIVGIVTSIANAGSGYVEVMLRGQSASLANGDIDVGLASADLMKANITNIFTNSFREQQREVTDLQNFEKGVADAFTIASGTVSAGLETASSSGTYAYNSTDKYYSVINTSQTLHDDTAEFASAQAKTRIKSGSSSPLISIETANPPADNSTIALYQFDNNGNDGGLLGNTLINNGTPAFSTATVKLGSHSLIGSDANYYTAPTNAFPIMERGTVEAWVYTTSLSAINTIFRSSDGTNESYLRISTAGQLSMKVGAGAAFTGTSASIATNSWNHVAMSWDGTVWRLYINGIETDSIARTNTFPASNLSTNNFIARYSSGGTPLVGFLDRFAVSNRVLSVNEIKNRASLHPYAVLTSQVIDIGQTPSSLGPISWTESLGSYGDVEFQTRSSADNSTWEAWKPTTSETQLASLNADQANWSYGSATIYTTSKADDTTIFHEGSGSLRLKSVPLPDATGSIPTDALWNFDETTGSIIYDEDVAVANSDLTAVGSPTIVPDGVSGAARNFNGSNQYYSRSFNADNDNYTYTNMSAWIKPSSCAAGVGGVMTRSTYTSIFLSNACVLSFSWFHQGGGWSNPITGGTIPLNQWSHVAYTFSQAEGIHRLYINGKLSASVGGWGGYYSYYYNSTGGTVGLAYDNGNTRYFAGAIDGAAMYEDGLWTDAHINHMYQQGLGKRVTKTLSTTDFTSKTKLPFSIASDRPGSFIAATVGENDFQNYVCDANTVSLFTLDMRADSVSNTAVDQCNTNSFSAYTGSPAYSDSGKLASARYFDGTDDYITTSTTSLPQGATSRTIDFWYKPATVNGSSKIVYSYGAANERENFSIGQNSVKGWFVDIGNDVSYDSGSIPTAGQWYHVAAVYDGVRITLYVNGTAVMSQVAGTLNTGITSSNIGRRTYSTGYYNEGIIDEVRISNVARSAADIAAVARISDRTNEITIDWVTHPNTGSAITNATTSIVTPETSGNIAVGDTIILVEKAGATETRAKNVVTAVSVGATTTTLTVATSGWAGTFPSGGFSQNADLTKFQREWFDMTDITTADKDAIARITLQYTDGNQGSNVWLDDITAGGAYLTAAGSSTVTSTANRYVQYRAVLSTSNLAQATTPSLDAVTFNYAVPGASSGLATLVSKRYEAVRPPITAYMTAIADLGANGIATYSASRNDGATWTNVTLTPQATYSGTVRLYSGVNSVANQSSGTAMRWRVQLSGSAKLYGVGLRWDDLAATGSAGLHTNSDGNLANGGYIEVIHAQNTPNAIATGWVYNTVSGKWDMIDATTANYTIEVTDNNTVRLYNNSGSTKNVRLDVLTGGVNPSSGVISLAPSLAGDVDSQNSSNTIWVNKTGTGGNIMRLQDNGTDVFTVSDDGNVSIGAATKPDVDLNIYGEINQQEGVNIQGLTDVIDTFVYDTTTDSDKGAWTNSLTSRGLSWYGETKDDGLGDLCNISTDDRCGKSNFPKKAILAFTTNNYYIFDAQDNTLWMKGLRGVAWKAGSVGTSIFAKDGVIYLGYGDATFGGIRMLNFKKDFDSVIVNNGELYANVSTTIANRDLAGSGGSLINTALTVADRKINDVHVQVIGGKTYLATANDAALSVINLTDKTTISYSDVTSDHYNAVWLTSRGNLYGLNETQGQLEKWRAVHLDTASELNGTPDKIYDQASTPALTATTPTISALAPDALFVDERGASLPSAMETIYVGTNLGMTRIGDLNGDESNSSAKYYTTTATTDEMIGDTRLMLPLAGTAALATNTTLSSPNSDRSRFANAFTTVGAGTVPTVADGVRGNGLSFDGGDYICSGTTGTCANDTDLDFTSEDFTVSMWINPTSAATYNTLFYKGAYQVSGYYFTMDANRTLALVTSQAGTNQVTNTATGAVPLNAWSHVVVRRQGSSARIYVNGVDVTNTAGTHSNPTASTDSFQIGRYTGGVHYFVGRMDEIVVAAEAFNADQIRAMYLAGRQAAVRRTIAVTDATAVSTTTITDSAETWTPSEFVGSFVELTGGTGAGQTRRITANTATTLTVSPAWGTTPDTTTDFAIKPEQLYGATNTTTAIGLTDGAPGTVRTLYVGTSDGSDGGGVTALRNDGDYVTDLYHAAAGKTDEANTAWGATTDYDDIISIDAKSDILSIGSVAQAWTERTEKSFTQIVDELRNQVFSLQSAAVGSGLLANQQQNDTTNTSQQYQVVRKGWGYQNAIADTGILVNEAVNFGVTFDQPPIVLLSNAGYLFGADPQNLNQCVNSSSGNFNSSSISTTGFTSTSYNSNSGYTNFRLCYTWIAIGTVSSSGSTPYAAGADLAEWYLAHDLTTEAGDIVAIDPLHDISVAKTDRTTGLPAIGVVSTQPGITLGNEDGTTPGVATAIAGDEVASGKAKSVPVALAGRVPVKVSLENGLIKKGDALAMSTIPGVAAKALSIGQIIGYAMEDFDGTSTSVMMSQAEFEALTATTSGQLSQDDPDLKQLSSGIGKVMAFIQPGTYVPESYQLSELGELVLEKTTQPIPTSPTTPLDQPLMSVNPSVTASNSSQLNTLQTNWNLKNGNGKAVTSVGAFSQAVIGNLRAGLVTTQELVSKLATFEFLKADQAELQSAEIATLSAQTAEVDALSAQTATISKLATEELTANSLKISSGSSALSIFNAENTEVVSIDQSGNASLLGNLAVGQDASIAGQLSANSARLEQLESQVAAFQDIKAQTAEIVNATVSGTLYADTIANLDQKIADAFKQPSLLELLNTPLAPATISTQETVGAPLADLGYLNSASSSGLTVGRRTLADLNLTSTDTIVTGQAAYINQYFDVNGSAFVADSLGIGQNIAVGNAATIGSNLTIASNFTFVDGTISYQPTAEELFSQGLLKPSLKLQPTGFGVVDLLAGTMIIEDTGLVTINGDLIIAGNLTVQNSLLTGLIEPKDYTNPLQVKLATTSGEVLGTSTDGTPEEPKPIQSRFEIVNELGTPVATISAQGEAEFSKVKTQELGIASEDLSTNPNAAPETEKTSGKAVVKAGQSEVAIVSKKVTADSLIYITPTSDAGGQTVYVKVQQADNPETPIIEGGFVVGFENVISTNVTFNWWIVN
jgi:hypothetical protein